MSDDAVDASNKPSNAQPATALSATAHAPTTPITTAATLTAPPRFAAATHAASQPVATARSFESGLDRRSASCSRASRPSSSSRHPSRAPSCRGTARSGSTPPASSSSPSRPSASLSPLTCPPDRRLPPGAPPPNTHTHTRPSLRRVAPPGRAGRRGGAGRVSPHVECNHTRCLLSMIIIHRSRQAPPPASSYRIVFYSIECIH